MCFIFSLTARWVLGLLLYLAFFVSTDGTEVRFHHVQDSRLCNNGNLPRYSTARCIHPPNVEEEFPCDTRTLLPEECRAVAIETETFSLAQLLQLVPTVDSDYTIRRIVVKMTSETIDIDHIGKEIDRFLTDRLWWYVQKEPHLWNKHSHRIVVLDRKQHEFERPLRQIAALNYPGSSEVCAKSALLFNRWDFFQPGWYSMLAAGNYVHEELPYAITAMYVSTQNSVNDSTAFITGSDCPTTVNKWECAFLPTTSCPLPRNVTTCHTPNCVKNSLSDTRWCTSIFAGTSPDAKFLPNSSAPEFLAVKDASRHPPEFNARHKQEVEAHSKFPSPSVKYLKPHDPKAAPFQSMMNFDMEFYTYSYILRQSAFYRSRIAQAIKEFQISNSFNSTDRCVAAQVRRGDRAMKGVNITEFCLRPENKDSDMGCSQVPFASVTLQHVIDSAAKIADPSVRTLIVTTDDEEWLDGQREEVRKTRPEWRVLNLKAPHIASAAAGADQYDYMRHSAGTASGVLLHGSIELSRQCEAFVGHFGCGGTMIVYKSMCAQHNHREYVCPPSFDVRIIPELRIHRSQ